jgi:hypothetical protein
MFQDVSCGKRVRRDITVIYTRVGSELNRKKQFAPSTRLSAVQF